MVSHVILVRSFYSVHFRTLLENILHFIYNFIKNAGRLNKDDLKLHDAHPVKNRHDANAKF